MNAIYNHAVKQKNQLQSDLTRFDQELVTAPISLQGSISATLVSFNKTIDQYKAHLESQKNNFKFNELSEKDFEKQNKYESRLISLNESYREFSTKFKELKLKYNQSTTNARSQLFGNNLSSDNPFDDSSVMNKRNVGGGAINMNRDNSNGSSQLPLYQGLRKEQTVLERGNAQLDYLLEMGQQSLDDMIEQNQVILKMQDKMSSSLRTLGVSDSTIHMINKRVFKDKLIFWVALFLLFLGIYLVLKWLR
ncbi:hypothetical protein TBLA_0C00330 [Henningerozyma blattae CBS 6284]|uniref:Protein transport protein BOS1 n=1 Tax=Henningerozyma blattae (strain ATCC 34711 / CBS 6284 / DSM 70876 / NBRC 10599 / NRRL Y-10934 / UCD 77-7) TaxID=1071380 RepID=I2H0E7_HENB6|nr:hypothetical protein TBLA_0C00330 [Tetrapisispora blattae CBS 6284]CCH59849.1 hypothetical protein TBLA_0C00330 [Tetrapisispora blattae CBS 6284]